MSVDASKNLVFKRLHASPVLDRTTAGITFTPAPMRTSDIIEKLRGYAPAAKATYEHMEKRELLALLERYQRANISTPLSKLEPTSSPAAGVASSSLALSAPSSSGTWGKLHRQAPHAFSDPIFQKHPDRDHQSCVSAARAALANHWCAGGVFHGRWCDTLIPSACRPFPYLFCPQNGN